MPTPPKDENDDTPGRMQPEAVIHPDGSKSDKELFEPMLGDDTFSEDVDYAKTPLPGAAKDEKPKP